MAFNSRSTAIRRASNVLNLIQLLRCTVGRYFLCDSTTSVSNVIRENAILSLTRLYESSRRVRFPFVSPTLLCSSVRRWDRDRSSLTPSIHRPTSFAGPTEDDDHTRATSSVHSTTRYTLARTHSFQFPLFCSPRTNDHRFTEGVLSLRERDHRSSLIVSRRDTVIAAH